MADELPSVFTYSDDISTAKQPAPLPPRKYRGTIRAATAAYSKKGKKMAVIEFFVSPDQYPPDYVDGNPDGTTLAYRFVSLEDSPQGRWSIRQFCETVGAPMPSRSVDLTQWLGLEAELTVSNGTFEGVNRANIDGIARA